MEEKCLNIEKNDEILVSVAIVTYNHEKFISQTIESILNQKTNFKIEIVIGEDCSTDKTGQICLEYYQKYPNKIVLLLNEENLGLRRNNINTWSFCRGKYIAMCEGDDYWTDNLKLQKQVDILEKNNKYSACFHQVEIFDIETNTKKLFAPYTETQTFNFDQIIERWISHTNSIVFKNFFNSDLIQCNTIRKQIFSSPYFWSDRPLETFIAKLGDYYYLPETMSVFRRHASNMTKIGKIATMNFEGAMAFYLMKSLFPENRKILSEQVIRWSLLAAEAAFIDKKLFYFLRYLIFAIFNIRTILGLKNVVKSSINIIKHQKIYE